MVDLIIWSRDRGCQLYALLESLELYAEGVFDSTHVIYSFSTEDYGKGYSKVVEKFPNINWHPKPGAGEVREYTMKALSECKSQYICFSTDDEIICRHIDKQKLYDNLPTNENHIFSLRCGYNTIEQDIHLGTRQPPLNIHTNDGGILTWPISFYRSDFNYGYFGSLDMNIYKRSLMDRLLEEFEWSKTNSLEGGLSVRRYECDYISSFEESVAVNVPCNNMSTITKAGQFFPYTKEELNFQFLKGKTIDIPASLLGVKITGCHQEIEWIYKSTDV